MKTWDVWSAFYLFVSWMCDHIGHTFAGICNPFSVEKYEEDEKNGKKRNESLTTDGWRQFRPLTEKKIDAPKQKEIDLSDTHEFSPTFSYTIFKVGISCLQSGRFFPLSLLTAVVHSCRLRVQGTQRTHTKRKMKNKLILRVHRIVTTINIHFKFKISNVKRTQDATYERWEEHTEESTDTGEQRGKSRSHIFVCV